MIVMVVGHGAREHALIKRIKNEDHTVLACLAKENQGIFLDASKYLLVSDYQSDAITEMIEFAVKHAVDLIIPAHEDVLFNGIADIAQHHGISCLGHHKKEALLLEIKRDLVIECFPESKLVKAPKGMVLDTEEDLLRLNSLHRYVMKPLHLGGKVDFSVKIDNSSEYHYPVWVEKNESGIDFSLHYIVSLGQFYYLGQTFDYPFLSEFSDVLTGGMGSVVPNENNPDDKTVISSELLSACQEAFISCISKLSDKHDSSFQGFISAQFRKVRRHAVFCELDCKPGDPEIVALLPTITNNFSELLFSAVHGETNSVTRNGASVAFSLVPNQYPSKQVDAHDVFDDVLTFGSSISLGESYTKQEGLLSNGLSRMFCVVGLDSKVASAKLVAERAVNVVFRYEISKTRLFYRNDIGNNVDGLKSSSRVKKSLLDLKRDGGRRFMLRLNPQANKCLKAIANATSDNETKIINDAIVRYTQSIFQLNNQIIIPDNE